MSIGQARATMASILLVAALLLFWRAASTPLLDPDEARFARTSVEMLRAQELVVPYFEGQPRLVKPPMIHWIQAALFRAFGQTELVARMHAALSTLGSILLVGWIAGRRLGPEGGLWAAACMATIPLVFVPARVGTLDALLSLHVLAAVALDIAEPEQRSSYRSVAVGALLGLAFLIKGPVGVVLPLVIMLAGRTASGRDVLPSWIGLGRGLAAWSVVVLPWGLAFVSRIGLGSAGLTLQSEVLERYFAGTAHLEPWYFYGAVAGVGLLPWVGPLLMAIVGAARRPLDPETRTARYLAAGLLVGLAFFSLGRSKLPTYILPLMPLAALLVPWQLNQELIGSRRRGAGSTSLVITLLLFATALGLAGFRLVQPELVAAARFAGSVYALAAIVGAVAWIRRTPRVVYASAAVAAAGLLLAAVVWVLPTVAGTRTSAYLIRDVPALDSGRPVIAVDMKVPSLTYYLDQIPELITNGDLGRRLDVDDNPLIVVDERDLRVMDGETRRRLGEVGRQGKYRVFEKIPQS